MSSGGTTGGTIRKHSSDTDTPTCKPVMKKSAVDCSTGDLMDAIKQMDSKLETRLGKVMQEQQSLRASVEARFSNITERIDKECKDIKRIRQTLHGIIEAIKSVQQHHVGLVEM